MMRPTPSIHARTPFYLQCSEFYKRHYAQISHAPPDRSAVMCARKRYCRDSRGYMPRTRRRVLHGGRLSHPSRAKPYLRVSRHIFCVLSRQQNITLLPSGGRHRARGGEARRATAQIASASGIKTAPSAFAEGASRYNLHCRRISVIAGRCYCRTFEYLYEVVYAVKVVR